MVFTNDWYWRGLLYVVAAMSFAANPTTFVVGFVPSQCAGTRSYRGVLPRPHVALKSQWKVIFANAVAKFVEGNNDEEDGINPVPTFGGMVTRIAAKKFNSGSSTPSSRKYTTRKVEWKSSAYFTVEGVQGDYNHYRTVALKNTKDRAVSLLTEDVMTALRMEYPSFAIQDGDLGENLYVTGVSFDFFRVGARYRIDIGAADLETNDQNDPGVILEITEKMDPCANLCKLPYINQESLEPKERILRCQDFLSFLDKHDGYRGWYAKVIQEGTIWRGSKVIRLSPPPPNGIEA